MTTLDQLQPGQSGTIQEIRFDHPSIERLMEMGLVPGTALRVVRFAPLGDPIEIEARGYNLSLRHAEAGAIVVQLDEP
jgi:Fe2+ transport system protein FeoA